MKRSKDKKTYGTYPAILGNSILLPDPFTYQKKYNPNDLFLRTDSIEKQERRLIEEARAKKVPYLFAHYKIEDTDPDKWQKLAMALAINHISGFQVSYKQGAPIKKSVYLISNFYRYFIQEKASLQSRYNSKKVTDSELCKQLAKKQGFKSRFPELKNAGQRRLQNLIAEARKMRKERVVEMVRRWELRCVMDDESPYVLSSPPDWIPERSLMFERYRYSEGNPPSEKPSLKKVSQKGGG